MDERAHLDALAPSAERLLARHEAAADEWFPHDYVPWRRAAEAPLAVDRGVASALVVNVLTEDNLPYYALGIARRFGEHGVWWAWLRRWTAEEMRHATALRGYLSVTRPVDLDALERARMTHVLAGIVPDPPTVIETVVYLALQELATRIAHWNTGEHLDDDGRRLLRRLAADETLHHLFYRDLVSEALIIDPSATVCAIDREIRHFTMPGGTIPGFRAHALAIADAGILSVPILVDRVFAPLVTRQWRLPELTALDATATAARDRVLVFLERLGRIARRLPGSNAI